MHSHISDLVVDCVLLQLFEKSLSLTELLKTDFNSEISS